MKGKPINEKRLKRYKRSNGMITIKISIMSYLFIYLFVLEKGKEKERNKH